MLNGSGSPNSTIRSFRRKAFLNGHSLNRVPRTHDGLLMCAARQSQKLQRGSPSRQEFGLHSSVQLC